MKEIEFTTELILLFSEKIKEDPVSKKILSYISEIGYKYPIRIKDLTESVYIKRRVMKKSDSQKKFVESYALIDRKTAEKYVEILSFMTLIEINESLLPNKLLVITKRGKQVLQYLQERGEL